MKKILIRMNQLLLILSTSILLLAIIISITILNKKYMLLTLEKNDYYNKVYQDTISTLEGYTIQVGLTHEEVEKILSKEKVKKDIQILINHIYDYQELTIDTAVLSDNLENLINQKLEENHREATSEEEVAIANLKKQVEDSYLDQVVYSKKYALKISNYYHKISKHQNKVLFLFTSFEVFCISLLLLITKSLSGFLKGLGSSFLSTFFFVLLGKILIQPKLQHILIFSSILSKLFVKMMNSFFQTIFIVSGIFGIIGLILIIIGVSRSSLEKK